MNFFDRLFKQKSKASIPSMAELKAVINTRYSDKGQREESIEGQICDRTIYAGQHG